MKRAHFRLWAAPLVYFLLAAVALPAAADRQVTPPNFLFVIADDLGWSDAGAFGGEIRTPTIDSLAERGLRLGQFYVGPTCSPTRAMFMTGLDNHPAGVGTMEAIQTANQRGSVNYGAQLHDGVVTVAEVLKTAGYQTYFSGKWHIALEPAQYPTQRGFDRSFALLQGGASHFADGLGLHQGNPVHYIEDGQPAVLPHQFYSSDLYADKVIEYISGDDESPFFAVLGFTAPHDPLQVPDAWLDRYAGSYAAGPDATRAARLQRIRQLGLFPEGAPIWQMPQFPAWLPGSKPAWHERSVAQQQQDARPMEIYAAMVELMDEAFGRVLAALAESGRLDNTYVVFFSDNGASGGTPIMYPHTTREWYLQERQHTPEQLGRSGSHVYIGREWATVSGTPWKLYKTTVGEGGIRSPFVVAGPGVARGMALEEITHVTDLVPTVFELVGVEPAAHPLYRDKPLPQGLSQARLWQTGSDEHFSQRDPLGTELFGNRAIRHGRWKATFVGGPLGTNTWELYDMQTDPGETTNVAETYPEVAERLRQAYAAYVAENGVIHPDPPLSPSLQRFYTGPCDWSCELRFKLVDLLGRLRG